eukprot:481478-Pyramimonas_sp.AAC.1
MKQRLAKWEDALRGSATSCTDTPALQPMRHHGVSRDLEGHPQLGSRWLQRAIFKVLVYSKLPPLRMSQFRPAWYSKAFVKTTA